MTSDRKTQLRVLVGVQLGLGAMRVIFAPADEATIDELRFHLDLLAGEMIVLGLAMVAVLFPAQTLPFRRFVRRLGRKLTAWIAKRWQARRQADV